MTGINHIFKIDDQLYRGGQFYWWRKPVLLVEETEGPRENNRYLSYIVAVSFIGGVPGENQRSAASH